MIKKLGIITLSLVVLGCIIGIIVNNMGNEQPPTEWTDWVLTVAPTCETDGTEMRVNKADHSVVQTRSVAARGHTWQAWATTTPATCLVAGVEQRTCSDCGNSDLRAIAALGHDWGDWDVTATCLTAGVAQRICENDHTHVEMYTVDALGHEWSEWVTDTAPTCEHAGVEYRLCIHDNNHKEIQATPELGHTTHDHDAMGEHTCPNDWITTLAPTCDDEGLEEQFCINCASSLASRVVPALGHNYGDWVVTTHPTETADGVETRICSNDASHEEHRTAYATGSASALLFTENAAGTGYEVALSSLTITSVVIPTYYNRLPVTGIIDYGFANFSNLETVIFLNDSMLISIGHEAFRGCGQLTNIVLPDSVEAIGVQAFFGCASLVSITIPAGVQEIGDSTFEGCVALEEVLFASGSQLTLIGANVFSGCEALKIIDLPDGLTEIGTGAFYGCAALESIVIYSGLETIGNNAFGGCAGLTDIYFTGTQSEWEAIYGLATAGIAGTVTVTVDHII